MCNLQTENKFWKDTFNAFQGIQERLEIKDGINEYVCKPVWWNKSKSDR